MKCDVCGNDYDNAFTITADGAFFCSAHCAKEAGVEAVADRV
jgi:hypothetical protein